MEFSVDGLKRIIRGNSDKHVSPSAAIAMNDELEGHGQLVAEIAWEITRSKGRVTVRATDIRDAIKRVNQKTA